MATEKRITAHARREAALALARADMRARATLRARSADEMADDIVRAALRDVAARRRGSAR